MAEEGRDTQVDEIELPYYSCEFWRRRLSRNQEFLHCCFADELGVSLIFPPFLWEVDPPRREFRLNTRFTLKFKIKWVSWATYNKTDPFKII